MTPLEVRQKIEALLREDPSPEAAALLARMPRFKCACGGRLSRQGRCSRCGATKAAPRQAAATVPVRTPNRPEVQLVSPGTSIFARP